MFSGSLKFSDDEDDNGFTIPANPSSSNLSSLFGTSMKIQDSNENASLKYIPPKQKQPTQLPTKVATDPQSSWSIVIAKAVSAFRLVNNENISQGKIGLALLKSDCNYKIILYRSKQNVLSTINLQDSTKLISQDNYIQFWDDAGELWSVLFDACDHPTFIKEIQDKCSVELKPQQQSDNSNMQPDLSTSKDNAPAANEDDTVKKTKASILSRMAKMGQPLPNLIASTTDVSSDSDNVPSEAPSSPPKPLIHPRASRIAKPSVSQIVPIGQPLPNLMSASPQTQYVTNFAGQLPTGMTSMQGILPYLAPGGQQFLPPDNLGVFFSESRTHNSEVRTYLSKLETKVEKILDRIDLVKGSQSGCNDRAYEDRIFELEKMNLQLKEELRSNNNKQTKDYRYEEKINELEIQVRDLKLNEELNSAGVQNLKESLEIETKRSSQLMVEKDELRGINKTQELKIKELEDVISQQKLKFEQLTEEVENTKLQIQNDNFPKQDVNDLVKGLMSKLYEDLNERLSDQELSQKDLMKVIGRAIREKTLEALK